MTVKEHYENHLAKFYSWMTGDFESNQNEFQNFLTDNNILPVSSKNAIDLGAGHGIQSVSLSKLGFSVTAVDFSKLLLEELKVNSAGRHIDILEGDIKNVKQFSDKRPELIICCGDTISHLENKNEIKNFLKDISDTLIKGGKALLSFRDYSLALTGDDRFLQVKSDDSRILTCVLEYEIDYVRVTDLLYEKSDAGWNKKVSSYKKVRIKTAEITEQLESCNLKIQLNNIVKGMTTLLAIKQ